MVRMLCILSYTGMNATLGYVEVDMCKGYCTFVNMFFPNIVNTLCCASLIFVV